MEELAIDVRNLSKKFGKKTVVNNISIRVPRGKIYGFLGPNGSGKTTSIRMICGLLTPDTVEGTCLGFNLKTQSGKIKDRVGYMTQKFSFWEDLTIRENLKFVARMFNMDDIEKRVGQAITGLGLVERQDQLAGALSGGWKQRLALAACILHEPELLLLDEPTAGVDPKARREFWDEIHRLAAKGLTVLVSTHYMDEAERCHEIIYIADGNIIAEGTVEDVINKAGLTTWIVEGEHIDKIVQALQKNSAVETMTPFGQSLHISGTDEKALEEAVALYQKKNGYKCYKAAPSLEDAFIHYMISAKSEA